MYPQIPSIWVEDRRAYPRVGVESRVWLHPLQYHRASAETEDGLGIPRTLRDLSFGGARFHGDVATVAVGERVEVVLPAMGQEQILTVATVVRADRQSEPACLAVRFEQVAIPDQVRLAKVLAVLLSRTLRRETDPDL